VTMRDTWGGDFVTRDPVKKQTFCDDEGPLGEGTVCDKGSS
jgi:hypothetical protein